MEKKHNYGEKSSDFQYTLVHENRVYMPYVSQEMGISEAEFRCEV